MDFSQTGIFADFLNTLYISLISRGGNYAAAGLRISKPKNTGALSATWREAWPKPASLQDRSLSASEKE
jgi:hypothetical protein